MCMCVIAIIININIIIIIMCVANKAMKRRNNEEMKKPMIMKIINVNEIINDRINDDEAWK